MRGKEQSGMGCPSPSLVCLVLFCDAAVASSLPPRPPSFSSPFPPPPLLFLLSSIETGFHVAQADPEITV